MPSASAIPVHDTMSATTAMSTEGVLPMPNSPKPPHEGCDQQAQHDGERERNQHGTPEIQERQDDADGHDAATVIAQPSSCFRDTNTVASRAALRTFIHRPAPP